MPQDLSGTGSSKSLQELPGSEGGGRREGKERRPGLWLQLSWAFRDEGSWTGCRLSRCSAKSTARLPKNPRQSWGVWTPSPSPGTVSGHPPSLHLNASPSISRSYGGAVKGHVLTCKDPVVGAVPSAARCLWPSRPGSPLPACASRLPAPGGEHLSSWLSRKHSSRSCYPSTRFGKAAQLRCGLGSWQLSSTSQGGIESDRAGSDFCSQPESLQRQS